MAKHDGFLPEEYLQTKAARRTNIICLTLFAVVMVGVFAAWFVTKRQWSNIQAKREQTNEHYQDAAKRIDQLEELQNQKARMIHKARLTSALVEKFPRSLILAELINHMPPTLGLLEFKLETKKLRHRARPRTALQRRQQANANKARQKNKIIELKPTRVPIELVGVAPTDVEVSTFIGRLNAYPMFQNVNLQYSEQTQMNGRSLRKFRVDLVLNKSFDVQSMKPTRVKRKLATNPMSEQMEIDPSGDLVKPPQQMSQVPSRKSE